MLAILTTLALALGLNTRTMAAEHTVVNVNDLFVDTTSFCVPVMARTDGKLILGTDFPRFTAVQSITTEWTNLETGQTVTSRTAGRTTTRFLSETLVTITGAVLLHRSDGTWVQAGLVEFIVEIDPNTGQEVNIVIREAGNGRSSFADALCAALQ